MRFLLILAFALGSASAAAIGEKEAESSSFINGRIVNGADAWDGLRPFQAGLTLEKDGSWLWCGGALIGANWVLTAAHCVKGVQAVTVYLGSTSRGNGEYSTTVHQNDIHIHPDYDSLNDIALVWIHTVSFSNNIQPISLPSINQYSSYEGQWAVLSGWGYTYDGSGLNGHLKYASVPVISNSECSVFNINDGIICTRTTEGRAACSGDSGGPLTVDGVLVGLVSFGGGCHSELPNGFARVSYYTNWIRDITGIAY
ncbi:serine protease 1-like [Anastrepha ludens]|uniref:serine protease 1-like n=1 Tax=Anastrepha ludens TaxID=28586 RepID=UPI0023B18EC8|nr:serine protease 1-like [Anastrepha ludens]